MMEDLRIIKKKYGENMMYLCRELFSTLMDCNPGLLSKLMLEHFDSSRFLYNDIVENEKEEDFKNYIYSFIDVEKNEVYYEDKTPSELLKEVGYTLYECHTEEEIQMFKKYYTKGEALCTFRGNRLNKCVVFFAVKDNVDEIKREDFKNPKREDEYGTSVISIQFTKNSSHRLSIKNRYNHRVNHPDATFSNNLDNIIPGLTKSFEKYYGMIQKNKSYELDIPGYVLADDGKYYKYNYEIYNKYYCSNNIIVDNFEVKKYSTEQYIILDYFIMDLKNKEIILYDYDINDCFQKSFGEIKNIKVKKDKDIKKIIVTPIQGEDIIIKVDKTNTIIGLTNNNINEVGDGFLRFNKKLQEFNSTELEYIGNNFLYYNEELTVLILPNTRYVGNYFLYNNKKLKELKILESEDIGDFFLYYNEELMCLNLLKCKKIGNLFLRSNEKLQIFISPNLEYIGDYFLYANKDLMDMFAPKVGYIGRWYLSNNKLIQKPLTNESGTDKKR